MSFTVHIWKHANENVLGSYEHNNIYINILVSPTVSTESSDPKYDVIGYVVAAVFTKII